MSPMASWARVFVAVSVICGAATFVVGFQSAIAILTLFGFAAGLYGLVRPVVGLFGIAVLCVLDPLSRVYLMTGALPWNSFNYLLSFAALLSAPSLLTLRSVQLRLLQAFLVLLTVGLLLTPDLTQGCQDVLRIFALFGLFLYFARASAQVEVWFWLGVVTGVLGAVIGLSYLLHLASLPYVDTNAWATALLTPVFASCLGFPFARQHRRGQLLLTFLAIINAAWIFLTGSRGGMLTALCCLAFLLFTVSGLHRRAVVAGFAALVAVAISTQFGDLQDQALHRAGKLIDSRYSWQKRTNSRSSLMLGGLRLFAQHPLLGVGTGGFVPALRDLLASPEMASYRVPTNKISHSAWIKVLAENGIPGVTLLAGYVLSFAILGVRSRDRTLRSLGILTTTAVAVAFLTSEFQGKAPFFLLIGTSVLLHRKEGTVRFGAGRRVGRLPSPGGQR